MLVRRGRPGITPRRPVQPPLTAPLLVFIPGSRPHCRDRAAGGGDPGPRHATGDLRRRAPDRRHRVRGPKMGAGPRRAGARERGRRRSSLAGWPHRPPGQPARGGRRRVAIGAAALRYGRLRSPRRMPPGARISGRPRRGVISFLDVGRVDATLIQLERGPWPPCSSTPALRTGRSSLACTARVKRLKRADPSRTRKRITGWRLRR